MKRTVRIPLSAALILGFAAPALAAFSDVSRSHPYAEAIAYVQAEGIVSGYSDGSYRPDQTVNRAEFVKIVVGSVENMDTLEASGKPLFSDVQGDEWYAPYLEKAVQEKIINGYGFTDAMVELYGEEDRLRAAFLPSEPINFAEASKILVIAMQVEQKATDAQGNWWDTQYNGEGAWWAQYANALLRENALPHDWVPERHITRGELAEMIYRLAIARGETQAVQADTTVQTISAFSEGASTAQYVAYEESALAHEQTVVLYFYAPWCPYCRANDARLEEWFAQGLLDFTVYKVDYDTAADLKGRFGVAVQDTFVKIDAQGEILDSISLPSETTLKAFLGV